MTPRWISILITKEDIQETAHQNNKRTHALYILHRAVARSLHGICPNHKIYYEEQDDPRDPHENVFLTIPQQPQKPPNHPCYDHYILEKPLAPNKPDRPCRLVFHWLETSDDPLPYNYEP